MFFIVGKLIYAFVHSYFFFFEISFFFVKLTFNLIIRLTRSRSLKG